MPERLHARHDSHFSNHTLSIDRLSLSWPGRGLQAELLRIPCHAKSHVSHAPRLMATHAFQASGPLSVGPLARARVTWR